MFIENLRLELDGPKLIWHTFDITPLAASNYSQQPLKCFLAARKETWTVPFPSSYTFSQENRCVFFKEENGWLDS